MRAVTARAWLLVVRPRIFLELSYSCGHLAEIGLAHLSICAVVPRVLLALQLGLLS